MFKISVLFLLACLTGCGEGMEVIEKECFAPLGEYVAKPYLDINGCASFQGPPEIMFLNTDKLDEKYLMCGNYLMLDNMFVSNACTGRQRKYLTTSEDGFDGSLILEMNCGELGICLSYWSLEFRRLQERN